MARARQSVAVESRVKDGVRRCRLGCMDEADPSQRAPVPCKHSKNKKQRGAADKINAVQTSAVSAGPVPSPTAAADESPSYDSGGIKSSAGAAGEDTGPAGTEMPTDPAPLGPSASADTPAFLGSMNHDAANTNARSLVIQPRLPFPDVTNNQSTEQTSVQVQVQGEESIVTTQRHTDTGETERAGNEEEDEGEGEEEEEDIGIIKEGQEGEAKQKGVRATEAQRRAIWLNMDKAHEHAQKMHDYEADTAARNRIIGRQLHRIIEKAAVLCQVTGTAMFVGFAHLEHGRHETKDVVWASPNICNPDHATLRKMTQDMHDSFISGTALYREAGRALRADELREHQAWIAEKIAFKRKQDRLEDENRKLRAQLERTSSVASTNVVSMPTSSTSTLSLSSRSLPRANE
ncbi:hypothetical protein CF336_g7851 [Tilletia laevis]|nr:hypothetical protein CF336_g7851 [Tilletia laevis]